MEESSPTRADRTGLDRGYNCRHVAPLHWLEEAMKTGGTYRSGGAERMGTSG